MAWNTLPPTAVDKNSPMDEALWALVKGNDDDHETRILALEGSSGSGGSSFENAAGEITSGGEINVAKNWKKRIGPFFNVLSSSDNIEGYDPDQKDHDSRLIFRPIYDNANSLQRVSHVNHYNGEYLQMDKDAEISFKLKKGENFLKIGYREDFGLSDSITVTIDGVSLTTKNITDIDGGARANTFSSNGAAAIYNKVQSFYEFDGEEHVINIKNTDSAAKDFYLDFFEFGYRSKNPTIDNELNIKAGQCAGRFGTLNFEDSDLVFTEATEGLTDGHTGSIVASSAGLEALDGESPAQTLCKPEEIVFSGAVTQLEVMNNFSFKDHGICLFSLPTGDTYNLSYTGKSDATPQAHSVDGIKWQSQPIKDFTPQDNYGVAAGGRGDCVLNYIGTAPCLIDATTEKLEFAITINGTRTVHVATISNGRYSADLVGLEKPVVEALNTAKALPSGKYFLSYSAETQRWSIGVHDKEVDKIEFLFDPANTHFANSIHKLLGFGDVDLDLKSSYLATIEKQHLCARVFQADKNIMSAQDSRIKYMMVNSGDTSVAALALEQRLALGFVRKHATGATISRGMLICPDSDTCGMSLSFASLSNGAQLGIRIDNEDEIFFLNTQMQGNTDAADESALGKIVTAFVSYPRGSKQLHIFTAEDGEFLQPTQNANWFIFAGGRQYKTKSSWEKIPLNKSIIEVVNVAPLSLYVTEYGASYSPTTFDSIDSITESGGGWANFAGFDVFNNNFRQSSTLNDFVDFDIQIVKDGGGFFIRSGYVGGSSSGNIGVFLNLQSAGITEANDRIKNIMYGADFSRNDDIKRGYIRGLKAGAYVVRLKLESVGSSLYYNSIGVIDSEVPNLDVFSVADQINNLMGTTYPLNVIRETIQKNQLDRVSPHLEDSLFKLGDANHNEYSAKTSYSTFTNNDESEIVRRYNTSYYALQNSTTTAVNDFVRLATFFKSAAFLQQANFNVGDTAAKISFNNVDVVNAYNQRQDTKAGSSAQTFRQSAARRAVLIPRRACVFNAGNVFNLPLTVGIKAGQEVILDDGVSREKAVVLSIATDVSFTLKKARSGTGVVDANVTHVEFHGFHAVKVRAGTVSNFYPNAWEYEPLTLMPSSSLRDLKSKTKIETVTIIFKGVTSGDSIFYPTHSDGIMGSSATSMISETGSSAASGYTLGEDLKDIVITSGTKDFKIVSTREVPV